MLLNCCANIGAEIFTAMADVEMLLKSEDDIMPMIDSYVESEHKRLEKLKRVAQEYQERNREVVKAGLDFVYNPLNSYLLIKRLTTDWSYLESLMRNNLAEVYLQNITSQRDANSVHFPTDEDFKGVAVALMRLQDVYKLETRDMAQGMIKGHRSSSELEAHDCFELGRIAYNEGDYYHTLMWMQEALNRMEHENPPTATEADILEYLAYALYQQGNLKRALSMTKKLKQIDPTHPRVDGNIKWYQDMMAKEGIRRGDESNLPPVVNPRKDDDGVNERDMYEALCRGEYPLTEKIKKDLYCYYKRDTPYLRLAPLKTEIAFLKPKILVFRNVLSDEEIEFIKEMAYPR
uniref:Prolyl 4-hydroxylase alpha-subunit N-terminal domain-containing protein n=1 Tax=Romanomermis culicivorax TaxID=13658 RepID=A0A915KVQ1_ROMCU